MPAPTFMTSPPCKSVVSVPSCSSKFLSNRFLFFLQCLQDALGPLPLDPCNIFTYRVISFQMSYSCSGRKALWKRSTPLINLCTIANLCAPSPMLITLYIADLLARLQYGMISVILVYSFIYDLLLHWCWGWTAHANKSTKLLHVIKRVTMTTSGRLFFFILFMLWTKLILTQCWHLCCSISIAFMLRHSTHTGDCCCP